MKRTMMLLSLVSALCACGGAAGPGVDTPEDSRPLHDTEAPLDTEVFHKAINLAGGAVTVEGQAFTAFETARTQGLSVPSGFQVAQTNHTPSPQVDAATSAMLNSGIWQPGALRVAQTVPSARYNVYLYILENYTDNYRSLDLSLEGQVAATGLGTLPRGAWRKYGPYTVNVTDGELTLDLRSARGDPHLMGLALFKLEGSTPPPTGSGRVYHVSKSGNDATGDGTEAKPFLTLARAADQVPADQGHTIKVGPGTFHESRQVNLKQKVNLVGSGVGVTIIRGGSFDWSSPGLIELKTHVPHPSGEPIPSFVYTDGKTYGPFTRYVSVDSPQELAHFSMEGQRTGSVGIKVVNRNGVNIHHVDIKEFIWAGIYSLAEGYAETKGLRITDFRITESAKEDTGSSWGNITLRGTHEGLLIQNGRIEHFSNVQLTEHFRSSGYAIKAMRSWEDTARQRDEIRGSKLLNIHTRGKHPAPWQNYTAPNIGFEFWSIGADGVEIANCDLNTSMSLEYNGAIDQYPYSFWVHHNRMQPQKAGFVELANSNIILEHNYFDMTGNINPWNVMGEFNNGLPSNQGPVLKNIRINHNVFNLAGFQPSFFVLTTRVDGFKFFNNTLVTTGAPTLFELRRASSQGAGTIEVRNNVFDTGSAMKLFSYTDGHNGTAPASVVYANNLHRYAPTNRPTNFTEANSVVGPAGLTRSGAMPFPYFAPASATANVVDRGANVGLPFVGAAPDLGALEYGQTPWHVGLP
ncbi:hypothetical protein [Pyxidicoccus xibeiensis]|uniref:hypothetical protein n=1 Tax=Pyxidicoccus xibeiensis TaxID=2906759 RepID=UPI0020A71F19|nr:hypothetical protein [Pyxidicoccus xibeiensis]MCP3140355.1 hypothetical protein [Pyxidicoccus xibeiensis]